MISILVAIVSLLSCAVRNVYITEYQARLILFAAILELIVESIIGAVIVIVCILGGDDSNDHKKI